MKKKHSPQDGAIETAEHERKWSDELFKDGEQSLHRVIGSSPIPAFVIGRDHRVIYWNRALEELSGIRAGEVTGTRQHWRAFYSAERPCMADLLVDESPETIDRWYAGKFIKSALIDEAYEATDFFPDLGKLGKWLRFTAAVIRNADGALVGAVETLEDITEAKQAEAALLKAHEDLESKVRERTRELARANKALQAELRERERAEKALRETTEQLSIILKSLPIVSYTCSADRHFKTLFVSHTISELTGYTPQQFVENPVFWHEHIHPDDHDRILSGLKTGIRKGEGAYQCEYRFQASDGSYRWFSDSRRLIRTDDRSRHYMVGAWRDITEDRRIRQEGELRLQQMIQSHKLTALGEVVAGVAHEINNPVSFIAYNIPLLEEMWNDIEPILASDGASHPDWGDKGISYVEVCTNMKDIIGEFKIATQRIKRVVSGLKEFARTDESDQKKPVQLADVIQGVLILVGAQIRKTVSRVDRYVDSNLPTIRGHFQKIEQVIANLLINAHQAIPADRKGRIVITARYLGRLDAILIEIEDNGIGMERDVLDHIFEPFYSTRRDKEGTGLGLSISYGLIKDHHGLIGVLSRPGLGSRFSVFLPVDGKTRINLRPSMLCIDHDPAFLNKMKVSFIDVLEWLSDPGNAPEDVIVCLEDHPEVDIVVSEIKLPGMNGWELLKRIRERFPLLTVVLYSADPAVFGQGVSAAVEADLLLKKPFNMSQLHNYIREVGRQRL
ncbi:MAG: PAS domain S-box protein [Pseudomonadota bacterium]